MGLVVAPSQPTYLGAMYIWLAVNRDDVLAAGVPLDTYSFLRNAHRQKDAKIALQVVLNGFVTFSGDGFNISHNAQFTMLG